MSKVIRTPTPTGAGTDPSPIERLFIDYQKAYLDNLAEPNDANGDTDAAAWNTLAAAVPEDLGDCAVMLQFVRHAMRRYWGDTFGNLPEGGLEHDLIVIISRIQQRLIEARACARREGDNVVRLEPPPQQPAAAAPQAARAAPPSGLSEPQIAQGEAMWRLPFVAVRTDGTINMWAPARIDGGRDRGDPSMETAAVARVYFAELVDHMRKFPRFDHGDMVHTIVAEMVAQGRLNEDLSAEFLAAIGEYLARGSLEVATGWEMRQVTRDGVPS